jgi:hypothetical protein
MSKKGKTQRYYDRNPKAAAKKDAYNSTYQKKSSAVKKRVEANRANRKAQAAGKAYKGDGKDFDHRTNKMVKASVNRGAAEKSRLKGSKRKC